MKRINFEKIFFYFIIIDILFLPYFSLVSTNYSLPIVFFWFLFTKKNNNKTDNFVFIMMFFLSLLSTLFSFVIFPKYVGNSEIYVKNINLFIQYTSYIVYYIMFKYYINKYHPNINNYLILFVFFVFGFCLIYYVDKSFFARLKMIWNNSDYFSISFLNGLLYAVFRYNFIWTDPNNVSYGIIMVVFYLLNEDSVKSIIKYVLYLMQVVIIIATMSVGGIVALLIVTFLYIIINAKKIVSLSNMKGKFNFVLVLLIIGVLVVLNYGKIVDNVVYFEAIDRISNNNSGSESRLQIWYNIIKNCNFFEYILIGKGGQTIVTNTLIRPHSGHFLMILSYGFLYYLCFIRTYFSCRIKKIKNYLFMIPLVIGFTINTLIGEQKLFIIYILIYLISRSKYENSKEK